MLGIKGTLSVVELKVLRQRMQAGQESKARRGELFKRLPVGYIKDATARSRCIPIGALSKPFNWYSRNSVNCGACARHSSGFVITMWSCPPTRSSERASYGKFPRRASSVTSSAILVYAGAYVWGRRPVETLLIEGRLRKRQAANRRPRIAESFIAGHHPGYIDWATYQSGKPADDSSQLRQLAGR